MKRKSRWDLLLKLSNLSGISGHEGTVSHFIHRHIEKWAHQGYPVRSWIDFYGNVYAHYLPDSDQPPATLLVSHLDEVGLIVQHIDDQGRVYCGPVGGIQVLSVIGQEVRLPTGDPDRWIHGVISTAAISDIDYTSLSQSAVAEVRIKDIYIDIGLSREELTKLEIDVGTPVEFVRKARIESGRIVGKALDDRVGCYVLLKLLSRCCRWRSEESLLFLLTTREELGQQGILNSLRHWPVSTMLILDVINTQESSHEIWQNRRELYQGPVIAVQDEFGFKSPSLIRVLTQLARNLKIPLQRGISISGESDDVRIIPALDQGVEVAILGVAMRNMHTPFCIASLDDIQQLLDLSWEFITGGGGTWVPP